MSTLSKTLGQLDDSLEQVNKDLYIKSRLEEIKNGSLRKQRKILDDKASFAEYSIMNNDLKKLFERYSNSYTYSCNDVYTCNLLVKKLEKCYENIKKLDKENTLMLRDLVRYYDALKQNGNKPCFVLDSMIDSGNLLYNKLTDFHVVIVDLDEVEQKAKYENYSKYGFATFVNNLYWFRSHISGGLSENKNQSVTELSIIVYKNKMCYIRGLGFYKIKNDIINKDTKIKFGVLFHAIVTMLGF